MTEVALPGLAEEARPLENRGTLATHMALIGPVEERGPYSKGALTRLANSLDSTLPAGAVVARWSAQRLLVLLTGLDAAASESVVREAWLLSSPRKPFPVIIAQQSLSAREPVEDAVAAAEAELVGQQALSVIDESSGNGSERPASAEPQINRILVVEDDPFASGLLLDRLNREGGFDVTVVEDGAEALKRVSTDVFDLAILDGMLPGLDGFTLLARIREDQAWDHVPVIMLTGRNDERDLVRGLELGADDYVVKPFSPIEVLARVRRLLEHTGRES